MLTYEQSTGIAKISCNQCPATLEGELNRHKRLALTRAVHMARLQHWAIERHAGAWQHFCPSCRPTREKGTLL